MTETATLGGGCFWCLEAVYQDVRGVESVLSGYMGGETLNPSYEEVCTGTTGHAEVVQVKFDPAAIGYADILDIFFAIHDPTTLNRQGNDVGPQYRSAIFTDSDAQAAVAREKIAALGNSGAWRAPLVTTVEPATEFYPAEAYHRNYFRNNPNQGYCAYVVSPKVSKFRKQFPERLRERPQAR